MLYPMYNRRVYWDIKHMNSDLLTSSSLSTTPEELAASIKSKIVYNAGNFTLFVCEPDTAAQALP